MSTCQWPRWMSDAHRQQTQAKISFRYLCHDIAWRPLLREFSLLAPCVIPLRVFTLHVIDVMMSQRGEHPVCHVYTLPSVPSLSPPCGSVACGAMLTGWHVLAVCPGGLWAYLWCWKLQPLLVTLTTLRDKLHAHSIPTLTPHCTLTLHHNVSALIIQQCWRL